MRRRATRRLASAWSLATAAIVSCGAPELGELPARCGEGGERAACPDGYACANGVCALGDVPVPITIAELEFLRPRDLRVVANANSVLAVWETYAYSNAGQGFVAARLFADGSVSSPMQLVGNYEADVGAVEPSFDVLATAPSQVLLAISAPPLAGVVDPRTRLLTYRVDLPPEGEELRAPVNTAAWFGDALVETVGYGAVSGPRFAAHPDHLELGTVQTRVAGEGDAAATLGELLVFDLELDGSPRRVDERGIAAATAHPVRAGLPIAVSVTSARPTASGTFWVLDDERPSALFLSREGGASGEAPLAGVAVDVAAAANELRYLEPSRRGASELADAEAIGDATLHVLRATVASPSTSANGSSASSASSGAGGAGGAGGGGAGGSSPSTAVTFADTRATLALGAIRDTPRPAWLVRDGKPSLVVTPGASIDAPRLRVLTVDEPAGAVREVAALERQSTLPLGAVVAAVAGGKLFVVWLESGDDAAVIRAAVIPEP